MMLGITWMFYALTASDVWSNTQCAFGGTRAKSFKCGMPHGIKKSHDTFRHQQLLTDTQIFEFGGDLVLLSARR